MKRLLVTLLACGMAICVSAQDNMEPFRHLSLGAEAGFHGFGVELAMPVQKHFVIKAGYNWVPSGDLFNTNITLDTQDLRAEQEYYTAISGYEFQNKFGDESLISAGMQLGLSNIKVMVNWYPFAMGMLYVAGGVYYTPSSAKDTPFMKLSGYASDNDWAALKELNSVYPDPQNPEKEREMALVLGTERYPVIAKDGRGYMQSDFKMDPLKYYIGVGLGRCVPNRFVGLQFEVGTMFYHGSRLYCQDKVVESIIDAAEGLGSDTQEVLEYVDKYPIYPQVTVRLSFRLF